MFLDWIAQLGLLPHDPQTNILGPLPLPIRRVLISEITNYLQPAPGKEPPEPALFRSTAHVKWYMEVLGQGFCLPLEDMDITSSDISIYAQWLFQPQMRPAAITNEALEQEFYQIIFHQCSLLFQPRITQAQTPQKANPTPQRQQGPYPLSAGRSSSFNLNMLPINPHANHVPINIPTQPIPGATQTSTPTAGADIVSSLVQRHIELCKKTLTILAMAGRTLDLSTETWTVLLKVVLGIADSLLKEPVGEWRVTGVPNMSDELCEHLLRVLFELWLRSRTRDVAMWDILKECFTRWTHRPKAIQQWSATSVSLTNRVFNLLYGPDEGSDMVILSVNGINVKLDLSPDFVYYAWHRILYLLPHPLDLPTHNFTLAMLCIGQLVDLFNNVGSHRPSQAAVTAPDGNTILNMFGNYLFDACSTAPQANAATERGCAEAFGTLCKIFCRPQRFRPFERTYIERFYASLTVGLKSDACLPTILLYSTELFVTDLEGIRMLVPDFIAAIKLVLPKLQIEVKDYIAVDDLRLAAIKVVSTIMCLPKHFDKVELKPGWDWDMQCATDSTSVMGEQEQIVTQLIRVLYADQTQENTERPFTCLKFYILELILMSLRTETSSYNMRYLLHLINVYVVEDVPFCPGLVGTVVKLIQEKILTMQMPSDVTLVAFDVLMDFVDLYDYVKRDSKNVARELVLALCRYVDTLMAAGKLNQTYPLIVQAYDCMIKWILVSQWIVDDRDCYKAVISTLSKGIMISDRDADAGGPEAHVEKKKRRDTTFPPTKQLFQLQPRANKNTSSASGSSQQGNASRSNSTTHKNEEVAVRMAAEYAMSLFVNQLGKFPSWNASNGRTDLRYAEEDLDSKESIRYFMVEKRMILAVFDVDSGSAKDAPAMIAILRDTTGKYIWSFETKYSDPRRPSLPQPPSTSSPEVKIADSGTKTLDNHTNCAPTAIPVNVGAIPSVDDLLERGSESWEEWYFVKSLADKEHEAETAALQAMQSEPLDRYAVAPTTPNINHEFARGFRLLLSDLGLFLPKNRMRITPLRNTDTLITEVKTLDMLNERDCISVTAYYALSGQASWTELVESPPPLSSQFLQFLNCLGWPVNIAEHAGYKGKLDPSICKTAPYYSDRNTEFLVNVPYFLQLSSADDGAWGTMDTISKIHQQVSSDDHVCVIWIEDLMDYTCLAERIKNSSSPQSRAMVYIFINPLKNTANGLFWIRILVPILGNQATSVAASQRLNESTLIFGPLVDGIVVSRHALGAMVRNTAISAHQACRVVTDTYTRPYILRRQFIEEMAHRHRSKLQLSEFYFDIFINKEN